MEILRNLLSINNTFVQLWTYDLSFIELIGTSFGLISVWLAIRANIHTWTMGIVNIIAFFVIYYQVQLYSDMFLQFFFLGASILGIWQWHRKKSTSADKKIVVLERKHLIFMLLSMGILTFLTGVFMSGVHVLFPTYFEKPAAYPYADAFTTILSIFATFLMAYKRVECWVLWIIVDVISIYLYFQKGIVFISIEYLIFLFMAIGGLIQWLKLLKHAKRSCSG